MVIRHPFVAVLSCGNAGPTTHAVGYRPSVLRTCGPRRETSACSLGDLRVPA